MFSPPLQEAFDINANQHFKNVQITIITNYVCYKETFNLRQLMQMMIRLQEHKKQEFLIVFFNYDHPMLMTNKIRNQYQIIEFRI